MGPGSRPGRRSERGVGYFTTPTDDLRWKYVDLLP